MQQIERAIYNCMDPIIKERLQSELENANQVIVRLLQIYHDGNLEIFDDLEVNNEFDKIMGVD